MRNYSRHKGVPLVFKIMNKRAYLFDFDGTLVDTMGGFADIAGRVIHEFHPEKSFEEAKADYLNTSGVPFEQQVEILFPGDSKNSDKVAIFEEEKKEGFFNQTFDEDVRYTIDFMRQRGDITAVCSNNFQELIDRFVAREGLVFDVVLGYRGKDFQKGRDHFEFIMNKFDLSVNDLVFVGDSLKDADKAFANKIKFIGKCGTFTREDFLKIDKDIITVNNLKEILDI